MSVFPVFALVFTLEPDLSPQSTLRSRVNASSASSIVDSLKRKAPWFVDLGRRTNQGPATTLKRSARPLDWWRHPFVAPSSPFMLMKRKHGTPPDWLRTVGRPIRGDYPPFPFRRSAFAAFQNEKKRSRRRFRAPTWQRRSVLAGSLTERRWRQGVENARVYTHTHTHTHTHKKRRKTRKKRTLVDWLPFI